MYYFHLIVVKTLAIKNTFEEQMLERRKVLKGKMPGMMEEGGIRYYLQVRNTLLYQTCPWC